MTTAAAGTKVSGCIQTPATTTLERAAAVVKELQLQFVLAYEKSDFQLTLDMMASGRIDPRPMVTDRVSLGAMPEAFEALKQPSDQCKVLVEP